MGHSHGNDTVSYLYVLLTLKGKRIIYKKARIIVGHLKILPTMHLIHSE